MTVPHVIMHVYHHREPNRSMRKLLAWKPQSEGEPSSGCGVQCGCPTLASFISCRQPSPAHHIGRSQHAILRCSGPEVQKNTATGTQSLCAAETRTESHKQF